MWRRFGKVLACVPAISVRRGDIPADSRATYRGTLTMKTFLSMVVLAFLASTAPAMAGTWWVVVGSEANPNNDDTFPANSRANDALAPCRMEAFSDWSMKWQGFRPGYTVSVLGAYNSRQEAETVRRAVSACIPDAYVRQGTYSGE